MRGKGSVCARETCLDLGCGCGCDCDCGCGCSFGLGSGSGSADWPLCLGVLSVASWAWEAWEPQEVAGEEVRMRFGEEKKHQLARLAEGEFPCGGEEQRHRGRP